MRPLLRSEMDGPIPDYDRDRRRTEQSIGFHVSSDPCEHATPRGGERAEVRQDGTGYDACHQRYYLVWHRYTRIPVVLNAALLILSMLVGGAGWMLLISTLNVATRMVLPGWVQARGLAVYLLVFQGGMAVGSLAWGALAVKVGVRWTLFDAGLV